jgi:3'-phosphoadenosine 5'-phosphosulfate (PAPS) 3'-phosphatase
MTRRPAPEALVAVASKSHRSAETDDYLARFDIADSISIGSSLKFCLVAEGRADLYPRLGRTMEWDTAAGHAVLIAAGGAVRAMDGGALVYGKRNRADEADFANPYFVAAGDAAILGRA